MFYKREGERRVLDRLIEMILERSFQIRDHPPFKLTSGKLSKYYINCKTVTLSPEGKHLIGNIFFDKIHEIHNVRIDAVGGLITGACPIVDAISMVSYEKGRPIKAFYVREERKGHGTGRKVEGDIHKGDRVIIVDDVITTGRSTIKAIEDAKEENLEVLGAIVLVDREEGGREEIEKHAPYCRSIVKMSCLKQKS